MWRPHLDSLLSKSWYVALSLGSSSNISVFWLSLGAIVLGWIVTVTIEWIRGGFTMTAFKDSLRSWPAYVGAFVALALLWIGVYMWSIVNTIYQDHTYLVEVSE